MIGLFANLAASGSVRTIARWVMAGALVLALCGLVWALIVDRIGKIEQSGREAGGAIQREANLNDTLDRKEKADAAAENVRRDADARRADCLRDARNPDDC